MRWKSGKREKAKEGGEESREGNLQLLQHVEDIHHATRFER